MGKTLRFLLLITVLITSTTTYADKNKRKVSPNRQAVECRADDCEISHRRAINIAQNYVYKAFRVKGRVSEVEYKRRYIGANYYEVEIKDRKGHEYEIHINARTGKVIATKIDLD